VLGIPGEKELFGRGVYTCAICEGSLIKGETVAVVGGGDSAIAKSLYLVPLVSKLLLIVRSNKFCAKDLGRVERLLAFTRGPNAKVQLLFHTKIVSLRGGKPGQPGQPGKPGVVAKLHTTSPTEKEWEQPLAALFLSIGITPNTALFPTLKKRPDGTLKRYNYQETSHPGIYVGGDATDNVFRQGITAAAEGCKCALQVKTFLDQNKLAALESPTYPLMVQYSNHLLLREPFRRQDDGGERLCSTGVCKWERKSKSPSISAEGIREIMTLDEWKKLGPNLILEVMSSNCSNCARLEFAVQDLASKITVVRIDLEMMDPEDFNQISQTLHIPDKFELPYFVRLQDGQPQKTLQGPMSPTKLKTLLE
jgi:hypothetical protein